MVGWLVLRETSVVWTMAICHSSLTESKLVVLFAFLVRLFLGWSAGWPFVCFVGYFGWIVGWLVGWSLERHRLCGRWQSAIPL